MLNLVATYFVDSRSGPSRGLPVFVPSLSAANDLIDVYRTTRLTLFGLPGRLYLCTPPSSPVHYLKTTSFCYQYLEAHCHKRLFAITPRHSSKSTLLLPQSCLSDISSLVSFHERYWGQHSAYSRQLDGEIMSESEVTKRYVQGVKTNTMSVSTAPPRAEAQTVTWHEVSEWQRDNKYILSGYRPEKADYLEIFTSLTFLHNETCNVYTHLLGALLLPLIATTFIRDFSGPQFLSVSGTDYIMFGIFFGCAEFCLVSSAAYHLLGVHSRDVEQFWHRMDLLGIVVVTVGTFIPGIYYVFACAPGLQKLHWIIVSF